MTTHHDTTDTTNCPCCGPSALTVADALAVTSREQLAATAQRLAYRPMYHVAGNRVVLIEIATNEPVLTWRPEEAHTLAQDVFAGPYEATLCMPTHRGTVSFARDETVAVAAALHDAVEKLHAPKVAERVVSRDEPWSIGPTAAGNRAARRARNRRHP